MPLIKRILEEADELNENNPSKKKLIRFPQKTTALLLPKQILFPEIFFLLFLDKLPQLSTIFQIPQKPRMRMRFCNGTGVSYELK